MVILYVTGIYVQFIYSSASVDLFSSIAGSGLGGS